jgi:hypothetical protein
MLLLLYLRPNDMKYGKGRLYGGLQMRWIIHKHMRRAGRRSPWQTARSSTKPTPKRLLCASVPNREEPYPAASSVPNGSSFVYSTVKKESSDPVICHGYGVVREIQRSRTAYQMKIPGVVVVQACAETSSLTPRFKNDF